MQRRAVFNLFHHEKRAGLAHFWQGNKHLPVQFVKVSHIPDTYFQKVVKVTSDQVAIKDHRQSAHFGASAASVTAVVAPTR